MAATISPKRATSAGGALAKLGMARFLALGVLATFLAPLFTVVFLADFLTAMVSPPSYAALKSHWPGQLAARCGRPAGKPRRGSHSACSTAYRYSSDQWPLNQAFLMKCP